MELDRGLLLGFVGLLAVLTVWLLLPYAQFVLAAVLLAFVLQPLHRRLADYVGATASAAVLTVGSIVAILLPLAIIASMVAGDAMDFAQDVQGSDFDYDAVEERVADATGRQVDAQATLESGAQSFAESVFGGPLGIFGTATHFLVGFGLFLFLLYFFVRDGPDAVAWLREVSPMPSPVTEDLLERIHDITRAVLAGHVLVAIIQGVLAGVGLVAVGVPNAAFWTFVMILLGLIPIIGTFVVWAPAAVWLLLEGQTASAAGLAVYGTIVVGISDDYIRPVVVDRYAHVSPAVIIIGVVGGMSVFGFMGLFVGPIVVAVLKESVEIYAKYYGTVAEPTDP